MANPLFKSCRMRPYFGTFVEIKLFFSQAIIENTLDQYWQEIWQICEISQQYWSFFDSQSQLSQFNGLTQTQAIIVDSVCAEPLLLSQILYEKSAGLFQPDIHKKPLNIYFKEIENQQVLLKNLGKNQLDLGGIAKGAAIDLLCDGIQKINFCIHMGTQTQTPNQLKLVGASVNAGGDLRVFGNIAELISIRLPSEPSQSKPLILLENYSIASSAHYGNHAALLCSDQRGISGSQLVPPYHVSVRAPRALYADALTKIVIASGNPAHTLLAEYEAQAMIIS